jgi:hypothetical protein
MEAALVAQRFIFRQIDYRDFPRFLADGGLKAKNAQPPQACHQTSYSTIVDRRGSNQYPMPCGGVVNDYVPFYFSPITSFSFTISRGNVQVTSPGGQPLGMSREDDRIFFVARPEVIQQAGLSFCFSDIALNSNAPIPAIEQDLSKLGSHVNWVVFDDAPMKAQIPEIGYGGVCQWFKNSPTPAWRMNRKQQRMAEFLVKDFVPLNVFDCVIVKTEAMRDQILSVFGATPGCCIIPVYVNRGCYFQ